MDFKKYKLIATVFYISMVAFTIHKIIFFFVAQKKLESNFIYTLTTLYFFFFSCAAVLIFILLKVKDYNLNNVGNTFLLVTCIKMAVSYTLLSPILSSNSTYEGSEKINFFVIFILFLAIETIVSIRILNNKQ